MGHESYSVPARDLASWIANNPVGLADDLLLEPVSSPPTRLRAFSANIFWSNDNATPIRRMADALGVLEAEEDLARVRAVYGKAGVPGY